ncbi:MAG TPA: extracellular solute-binding protein [Candidatus Binatia bacterium]|nr:extracellular solute-binding protein [Candidatus Binatia bacterium]
MRCAVSILVALSVPVFFSAGLAQDLAKAKQEGRLVFYTSWGPSDADYVIKAFEKRYPPLRVEIIRASSERTLTRLLNEHRAGTFLGDVVAVSGIQSGILKAKGALDRYQSAEATNFPAEWRDPDGYGTGLHQTIYVIGYNSRLVSPDAVPKSYEDLLQPRWRGQLGWDTEEYYLFGALMKARGKEKGLEYWRRLAGQQINFRKGYTLISELISAGEFPMAVSLYQHRVDEYAEKGAPLQWIAPNPLVGGDPNKISLLKNAPRPNAAKLFIDFMLSAEGQKLLQDKGRSPGRLGVGPRNPRLKGAKIFTLHVNAVEYAELAEEFNRVFKVK